MLYAVCFTHSEIGVSIIVRPVPMSRYSSRVGGMSKIEYGTDRISLSTVVDVVYAVGSRWRAAGRKRRGPLSS
jgi:hypothetical protein